MRNGTVARKYAETLFDLAVREQQAEEYGDALSVVSGQLDAEHSFRLFLETPRIDDQEKKALVRKVFGATLPTHVLNFLLLTIDKRRQRLLQQIASEYALLVDERLGREHVEVTLARSVDEEGSGRIAELLSTVLGKKAIPHVRVKPEILGGIIVRTGDTIYDGSVRRRLEGMRTRMLDAELPAGAAGSP